MGDSLGMLLTLEKEVHWFMNDVWRGCVRVEDYPLDTPMWGVVDVYGWCKQVEAEIYTGKLLLVRVVTSVHSTTVSRYNPDSERRLGEMGLIVVALAEDTKPQVVGTQSLFARVRRGIGSKNSQDGATKTQLVENGQLLQQLDTKPHVVGTESLFARLRRGIGSKNSQDGATKTVSTSLVENGQLQQQLTIKC